MTHPSLTPPGKSASTLAPNGITRISWMTIGFGNWTKPKLGPWNKEKHNN